MNSLMVLDKVKEDEDQFITDLIETKGANLPEKIDEVLNVFEFTDWKAKAWKTLADKMSRLEDQQEAYHSALRSGQQWGIAALYSQKRMGEITRDMPTQRANKYTSAPVNTGGEPKTATLENNGIKRYQYEEAEKIASHPEILDRVIESSQKRGEIPTKTAVLNTIKSERNKEYAQERKAKQEDKLSKTIPKIVSDYYESLKMHKKTAELALIGAKNGKFDPAGKNFMIKKNNELRELMNQIEEAI